MKFGLKERNTLLRQLKPYMRKIRLSIVLSFILKFLSMGLGLVAPFLFKLAIDGVLIKRNAGLLLPIFAGYIGVFLAGLLFDFLALKHSNIIKNRLSFHIRKDMLEKLFKTPIGEFEKMAVGDIELRINSDVSNVAGIINSQLIDYYISLLFLVIYFVVIFIVDWRLTLCLFLTIPLTYFIGFLVGKGFKSANEKLHLAEEEYRSWQSEILGAWKEIKAQNLERHELKTHIKYRHKIGYLQIRWITMSFSDDLMYFIKEDIFTRLLSYLIGGFFLLAGTLTLGTLLMFVQYFTTLFDNIVNMNEYNINLIGATPSSSRIYEILNKTDEAAGDQDAGDFKSLTLSDVSFTYEHADAKAIDSLSLTIEKGETVAIVGRSGCGKSTLASLMLGLIKAQEGSVAINGININDIKEAGIYSQLGAVMQSFGLFNLSIRDNLLVAKPGATDADLINAAKRADMYDFITSLPESFDTIIGEKGIKLSGGQRQRMAIAQILLKNPPLIILDESTSSLDFNSEQLINKSIEALSADRTVIIIAHRLSSITYANKVIVMDAGKIVDVGTHSALLSRCEVYNALYKVQHNLGELSYA
jgi:ABC-type multidrug transport system fused ATPase/permease subunit